MATDVLPVHGTIGQDADVIMFVYREEYFLRCDSNAATPKQSNSRRISASHW